MEAYKLSGMAIVKDLSTEEEFNAVRDFLLTDPLKITHTINFWKNESINASPEEKVELEKLIVDLKNHLKNQAKLTLSVYQMGGSEVNVKTEKVIATEAVVDTPAAEVTAPIIENAPQSNLKVVARNGEDVVEDSQNVKTLREKYATYIKKINFDGLKKRVTELMAKEETQVEGVEFATFILGEGLYQGKKAKKWDANAITSFLNECKPAEETPAADEDLSKKYAMYLDENTITLPGLKTEIKYLLSNNEVEKGLELSAYLLGTGQYATTEGEPFVWSAAQIEDFINGIREDIKTNPLVFNKEEVAEVKNEKGETVKVEPTYEMTLLKLYNNVDDKVFVEKASVEDIKKYIFDTVKSVNVETLEMFHNVESVQEELDSMYEAFFNSYVNEKFKELELKSIDVKGEIAKLVAKACEAKAPGLAKVMQDARRLYELRGERVSIKECKKIVYQVTQENHPEYYNELVNSLGEKPNVADNNAIIVPESEVTFENKYPELYETVKDAKCLDDVFTLAREMEKSQSFLIVSEMIMHLISSGKIKDDKDQVINWDKAQIELWINTAFTQAETVAETTEAKVITPSQEIVVPEVVVPDVVAPEVVVPEVVVPETVVPTQEVASPETTESVNTEMVSQENTATPETAKVEVSASAALAVEATADAIEYPTGISIPEEDKELVELYAAKKEGFWQGIANIINRLTASGKDKKEITHILSDKIKELSKNDDLTQAFVRNFKKTNVNELYKVVNKIAAAMNVNGWAVA